MTISELITWVEAQRASGLTDEEIEDILTNLKTKNYENQNQRETK